MKKLSDTVLHFTASGNRGACRQRDFETPKGRVVVVSEYMGLNPGPSITNSAEAIDVLIHAKHPAATIVHHFRGPTGDQMEIVSLVEGQPVWTSIGRKKLAEMTGAPETEFSGDVKEDDAVYEALVTAKIEIDRKPR